jgi:hypothetical protein
MALRCFTLNVQDVETHMKDRPNSFGIAFGTLPGFVGLMLVSVAAWGNGKPFVVFDTQTDGCDSQDLPDMPARAFRDASGTIHLFAYHFNATENLGRTLLATKHDCRVVMRSDQSKSPQDFDDFNWLTSFYTQDGKTVVSIVHVEFHGADQPALCPSRKWLGCMQTSIAEAISTDGGFTFSRSPGAKGLVASLPHRYLSDQNLWYGFMNPTNIITDHEHPRYKYFMVSYITPVLADPPDAGHYGVCLLRSATPEDPHSWRAWGGRSFNIEFKSPYIESGSLTRRVPCQPIGGGKTSWTLGSVSWYSKRQLYVLTMRCQPWEKGCIPGAYISTSRDLIDWSMPIPLLLDSQTPTGRAQTAPSLLDPAADDRNFQDVTDSPWLFTIEMFKVGNNDVRRLLAYPVHLQGILPTKR